VQCCGRIPTFRRTLLPQFPPDDGGSMVLRNVGIIPQNYTASQPKRLPDTCPGNGLTKGYKLQNSCPVIFSFSLTSSPTLFGSLPPRHGASSGCGWRRPPNMEGSWNVLNKQLRTADKGWSSSLGFGREANNSPP